MLRSNSKQYAGNSNSKHAGNYFVPISIRPIFLFFFVAEVMSNYLTTDGLKKISLLPKAPFEA